MPMPPDRRPKHRSFFMNVSVNIFVDKRGVVSITRLHPENTDDDIHGWEPITPLETMAIISALSSRQYRIEKESEEKNRADDERSREKYREGQRWLSVYGKLPRKSGVYAIRCSGSGKAYVGASQNIRDRVKSHTNQIIERSFSGRSRHAIAEDVEKFGVESITVEVLEIVDDLSILAERERYWIATLDSIKNGYNKIDARSNHLWVNGENK
jgi:hypothetical protein